MQATFGKCMTRVAGGKLNGLCVRALLLNTYSHSAEVFVKQLTKLPRQNATLQRRCEVDRSPYRDRDHLQNLHTPKPPLPI